MAAAAAAGPPEPIRWALDTSRWRPGQRELDFLLALLPGEQAAACRRFARAEDRCRALASRLLQRACVATVTGAPWEGLATALTKGGRPYYPGPHAHADWPNFNYSVSHEARRLLLLLLLPPWQRCSSTAPARAGSCHPRAAEALPPHPPPPALPPPQGSYVVLAAESHCIVGVDLAAPLSLRAPPGRQPCISATLASLQQQFAPPEVRRPGRACPSASPGRRPTVAPSAPSPARPRARSGSGCRRWRTARRSKRRRSSSCGASRRRWPRRPAWASHSARSAGRPSASARVARAPAQATAAPPWCWTARRRQSERLPRCGAGVSRGERRPPLAG
jgi:hypothetical protein